MRPVRRTDREISQEQAVALLDTAEYGVLSTVDGAGQPYGVPLSFVHRAGRLYFHCALEGHKLDNLAANPRVAFCVVGRTRVLPAQFATEYESAVAFGVAAEVHGDERHAALLALLEKYSPEHLAAGERYIAAKDALMRVFRITIHQVSGKARR